MLFRSALTGLMPLWPQVLMAPADQAPLLLREAGETLLSPSNLGLLIAFATALILACQILWKRDAITRVAAVTLATTLVVDGCFLTAALLAPRLSGLI